jgi:plasmid maintenance system antidote protein VapI
MNPLCKESTALRKDSACFSIPYDAGKSCFALKKGNFMQETFADLLHARGLTHDAAAVLGDVETSTISRIVQGKTKARPVTVVKLAKALGVGAKRMQAMCDASWLAAHPDEQLEAVS